jgi:hypothetical protein
MEHAVDDVQHEFPGRIATVGADVLDGDGWADVDFGDDELVVIRDGGGAGAGVLAKVEGKNVGGAVVIEEGFVEFGHVFLAEKTHRDNAALVFKTGQRSRGFEHRQQLPATAQGGPSRFFG